MMKPLPDDYSNELLASRDLGMNDQQSPALDLLREQRKLAITITLLSPWLRVVLDCSKAFYAYSKIDFKAGLRSLSACFDAGSVFTSIRRYCAADPPHASVTNSNYANFRSIYSVPVLLVQAFGPFL